MAAAGKQFDRAGVAAIYLVHGTFCGNDILGLWTELARYSPRLAEQLRRSTKAVADMLLGEIGNYTKRFTLRLEEGLAPGAGRTIPVRRFHWSSQNNHIGRADGAVLLVAELAKLAERLSAEGGELAERGRVLLWGHSHGGNVFALATHLLGEDAASRQEFFTASERFFRRWGSKSVDLDTWQKVQDLLARDDHPVKRLPVDMVTFGTPIRYGWETSGYDKLLHVTNHRQLDDRHHWQAPHPFRSLRALLGRQGDFIQQIGIAGTNFAPIPLALRTFLADRGLDALLERDLAREWVFNRLVHGTRVADEGPTLLVDYDEHVTGLFRSASGHAVYTRSRWLPFHCETVAAEFYGAGGAV